MREKKPVLIICHTAAGQMYLGVVLNRIWYSPVLVRTVQEAIQLSRQTSFTLIVFDADLSDSDLHDGLSMLRTDPSVKNLPLIVFTSLESKANTEMLLSKGCSAVLRKPLDLALVYGVLARLSGQPRTTPRASARFRVQITEATPEPALICVNISEGGLYLRTAAPLPEHSVVHLRFTLPRSSDTIEVAAAVVRTSHLETHLVAEPGMGLKFIDLPETIRDQIRNFVQWELIGDLEWEPNRSVFEAQSPPASR